MAKFAHHAVFDYLGGGRLRVSCKCGKQSPVFLSDEDTTNLEHAEAWYIRHTGLKEVKPTQRS